MNPILGPNEPDPISEILGTGFHRFNSPTGIRGLAKEGPCRLDVLAVMASNPGTGQFRAFIKACKQAYCTVIVWSVMNPDVDRALERYEFVPYSETDGQDGDRIGMRWG